MKVYSSYDNGRLRIFLEGELDHHGIKGSSELIDRLLEEYLPRDCVLDLGALSFMDSSGIALILRLHRRLSQVGGRVWIENAGAQPLRVLDASGVERIVKIALAREAR